MSEEQPSTNVEPSEVETTARSQGWVPKEEFRGNESDWIEAEVFVQRGKEINPILRKNNERIQKELDATKRQMEELRKTTEEFKKFQKDAFEHKLKSYEDEISELKDLKKRAVSEGDGDLVVELDDQIDALKTKKAEAKAPEELPENDTGVNIEVQQAVADWVGENSWYKDNPKQAAVADALANEIRKDHPYLIGKEFLEELDKALLETFTPEKLGKKVRPRTPVEGGKPSSQQQSNGKKSYNNLPADAKAACDKFVRQKLMTQEEYVNTYSWE